MKTYHSKWNNIGLREMAGTNKLYDIVEYYGGFLWYTENVNEGAFEAFYNNRHHSMTNVFINRANAEAKKYLSKNISRISGRKMKHFLITGRNKRIVSYEWIADYAEYILNECYNNELLVNKVNNILMKGCIYCIKREDFENQIIACAKRLLGFQYDLLHEVKGRENMTAQRAQNTIDKILEYNCWQKIVSTCNSVHSLENGGIDGII